MIRILNTADLHLGAVFPELADCAANRRADQLATFERIIALAMSNKVHLLLVAGDLFASPWPAMEVVTRVQAGFKRLCASGILPVILPGLSDTIRVADGVYGRGVFEGVLVLDPHRLECVKLDIEGQILHLHAGLAEAEGIVWPASVPDESAGLHIGLLHLPASAASNGAVGKWLDAAPWQEWGFDYLALGGSHHYHEWREDGRIRGCCPGSPEGLAFGENGVRYCVLSCLGSGQARIEKHPVNRRVLEEKILDVSVCRSMEQVLVLIRSLGNPDALMRVSLTGQANLILNARSLQTQAADAFYYLEVDDRTPLFDSPLIEDLARGGILQGMLVRKAQTRAARLSKAERPLLEAALRDILQRRQPMHGEQ
jgi:DNA repair exonuclease SbcCD nuclease subunit